MKLVLSLRKKSTSIATDLLRTDLLAFCLGAGGGVDRSEYVFETVHFHHVRLDASPLDAAKYVLSMLVRSSNTKIKRCDGLL